MTLPSDAPALAVEDLSVAFGDDEVLRGLTFRVAAGASLVVIGPNGSGKTVLFRALIGAIPHGGRIRWAEGTRLGYVPQKLDLERDLPITGVDLLAAKARVTASPGEVRPALDRVGLRDEARRPIGELSGGQFQRLLVALALVGRPNVLLLDEPTSGVDAPGQARVYELLRGLQRDRGMTVLLISHELSVVYRFATEVLCLHRERAFVGPPRAVLTPERLEEVYGAPVEFHVHGP